MKRNSIKPALKAGGRPGPPLNPLEVEVIAWFMQFARALGQRPSFAEIYGLLFVSPRPLPQDDFIGRLNLSKGSASQGLRYLQDLGAVGTVAVPGDRRVHYEAVAELRRLAGRFLERQVFSCFQDSGARLKRLAAKAKKLANHERDFAVRRIELLQSWESNSRSALPILTELLGAGMAKSGHTGN